jgi:hypothetical protein
LPELLRAARSSITRPLYELVTRVIWLLSRLLGGVMIATSQRRHPQH